MGSSSSCELTVHQHGARIGAVAGQSSGAAASAVADGTLDGSAPFTLAIARSGPPFPAACVRASGSVLLEVREGIEADEVEIPHLDGEFGHAESAYDEGSSRAPGDLIRRLELLVHVTGSPSVMELHAALLSELERAHSEIATDFISRTTHRGSSAGVNAISPEEEIRALEHRARVLEAALARIGAQPSVTLIRDVRRRRWRPGLRLRPSAAAEALRDQGSAVLGGRVVAIGRAQIDVTRVTSDIAEHRHIRAGIDRLMGRCLSIRRWCERAEATYGREVRRWSETGGEDSPLHREIRPRLAQLQTLGLKAERLGRRFRQLSQAYGFLRDAGEVRARLAPTPIFLTRPGYRESYDVLRALNRAGGMSFIGEDLRLRFKALSRLYEYWCFIAIVGILDRLVGAPAPSQGFRVIDDLYRPDLEPGQSFSFRSREGATIHATYEPDIVPMSDDRDVAVAGRPALGWRATLATAPLRPDVLIEIERRDRPPVALVLDAKSSSRFGREDLWVPTDYRTRIVDPGTGAQPVRQVFFLHPNPALRPLESLPGYLRGRRGDLGNSIIGSIGFRPGATDLGVLIVQRFLSLAGVATEVRQ